MKLVGFGCSFTYGSELQDQDLEMDSEYYRANTPYREKHCWLGQLAEMSGCSFDNRSEPSGSNLSIQEKFAAWFIRSKNEKFFRASFKEWVTLSYDRGATVTNHAKLFVNSVCQVNNIKIIQFNALDNIPTPYKFPNYHQGDQNMQDVLRKENINLEKNFLAPGEHPNEAGHKHYAKMLHSWAEAKKIL